MTSCNGAEIFSGKIISDTFKLKKIGNKLDDLRKKQISIAKIAVYLTGFGSTDIFIVYLTILNHFVMNLTILHIVCRFGPPWVGGGGWH